VTTITKKDMVMRLAVKTKMDKSICRKLLQASLDEITELLKAGDRVEFRHFGVFAPVTRKGRVGRNPRTGGEVVVPARIGVRFRTGTTLRRILAGLPVPKVSDADDEE
jgi:DNA-binding protein HU-beta